MRYNITNQDTMLVQLSGQYKYRLFIIDKNENVLGEVQGISSVGSYNIDSDSNTRRTTQLSIFLDNCYKIESIEKKLFSWIGYDFHLQIGIYSDRDEDYRWYDCGYYVITEGNTNYDAATNSLTVNLADWYTKLDGTRNGQIGGAPTIYIPNLDDNGKPVTIRTATVNLLKSETNFTNFLVDDIGEFYGMSQNNTDYETYRTNNPLWNQLPYDLEYEVGCTVGDIFDEIKNLYSNCQMYFDVYGNFCFNLIPSCEHDPIRLDDDFIQSVLVADNTEDVSYDIGSIKNVTEVFGATYEIDRYTTECTTESNIYTITLENYSGYSSGDMIAFIPNTSNISSQQLKINSLDVIPIYNEFTTEYIAEGILKENETYVIQLKYLNGEYVAYYLGQYQPHALCVLTNNENDEYYTKSHFAKKYNCSEHNVILRVEEGSPFCVQKLGEVLDVKTGEEFDNILSDSVARDNAIYFNRKSSSVYDTVTITTKMIPFLDVNEKVEYRKQQETDKKQYITKSISNNTDSLTSQITMYRFYPLYFK